MKKILTLVFALSAVFSFFNASATIHGTLGVCVGGNTSLYDSVGTIVTGTWSSSNPTVASVVSSGTFGIVTGHVPGTATITCTSTSGVSSAVVTVTSTPGTISGPTSPICPNTTATVTCTVGGGTWSSSAPGIAHISPGMGLITGVVAGTATISYIVSPGCAATYAVTVATTPFVDSILGATSVCVGGTGTLTCTTAGGAWTSGNPSIVSVSSTGVVTGVAAGNAWITYTVPGTPCPGLKRRLVSATTSTTAGTLSGLSTVNVGSSITLYSTVSGGTWSSSSTATATVSSSGSVTGVAGGVVTISYAISGGCGTAYATKTVNVTVPNCIRGNVNFSGTPHYGTVKVWLIKYNPSTLMLYAVDSVTAYSSGTSAPYSFCGMGTDLYRVKAALDTVTTATTGYQPTYHTASAYWNTATVISHTAGTVDAGKDINMNYGTITSGPGFIGGNVTTGANKGTADPIPAIGLLVYCVDNTTGAILQQAKTNTTGYYAFSDLPIGTYKIYPELINYATTPYPPITLTTASASKTGANFEQRTISMTIVPVTAGVGTAMNEAASMSIFPNPANDVVNIGWNVENAGIATINIADIAGRNILTTTADMSASSGTVSVPVNDITKGIYLISVKANGVNYTSKIVVE